MQFTILHLFKIYDDERWADEFMKGRLHLKRLSHFKKRESRITGTAGRANPNEAVAVWLQKASVEFKDHPELNIAPTDLARPIYYELRIPQ